MNPEHGGLVSRFHASMEINFEKWHDGVGYDISLIGEATPQELAEIESILVTRSVRNWRDVEALAAMGSDRAMEALRRAFENGSAEIKTSIITHAPHLIEDTERTASLVSSLESATLLNGLSRALDEIVDFHPPEIIAALLHGARHREGEVAVNFAGMLFHLHGKSEEPFDLEHRNLFLRFHTDTQEEREVVFKEFCRLLEGETD